MGQVVIDIMAGAAGAALVTGAWALIQYKIKRRDAKSDQSDVTNKALRYLMLYIIQERAKSHIKEGKITLEDRRLLNHWHTLYHEKQPNGLGGNGDADVLMKKVNELPPDFS